MAAVEAAVGGAAMGIRIPPSEIFPAVAGYGFRALIFNVFVMVSSGFKIVFIVSIHLVEDRSI